LVELEICGVRGVLRNDLPGYVKCVKLVLYADEAWLFDSELVLNTAKTSAMLLHFSSLKYIDKTNIMLSMVLYFV
jgi:hypothetical protein